MQNHVWKYKAAFHAVLNAVYPPHPNIEESDEKNAALATLHTPVHSHLRLTFPSHTHLFPYTQFLMSTFSLLSPFTFPYFCIAFYSSLTSPLSFIPFLSLLLSLSLPYLYFFNSLSRSFFSVLFPSPLSFHLVFYLLSFSYYCLISYQFLLYILPFNCFYSSH